MSVASQPNAAMCEEKFKRTYAALDQIFSFIDAFGAAHDVGSSYTYAVRLAVEELFTNMVKYNAAGTPEISIRLDRSGDHLHVSLIDEDADAFDPSTHPEPVLDRPLDQRPVGGLGLHLVRHLVDEIRHDYSGRRNIITITKNVAS